MAKPTGSTLTVPTSGLSASWAIASNARSAAGGFKEKTDNASASHMPKKVPDFTRVRTWPSCEVNGMVLVWYHREGVGQTRAVPEPRQIATKERAFRGQKEQLVDAHIQSEHDITIWNNEKHLPKLLLVREDSSIRKHWRWYAPFYSEKNTRFPAQQEGLDR